MTSTERWRTSTRRTDMPRKRWRWSTGNRGATIRVFERQAGGPLYAGIPLPGGGYRRVSLGHRDKERARRQAVELSARRLNDGLSSETLTLSQLFALYLPTVGGKVSYREQIERAAHAWRAFLGPNFPVRRISPRDWETFSRRRANGEIDADGRPVYDPVKRCRVGANCVAYDLRVLRAACKRATIERAAAGGFLLQADPTRGLAMPVEKNPRRPTADHEHFERTVEKAQEIDAEHPWKGDCLRLLLWVASDTGRRIAAILSLRWSDWNPS
jgi:hypothetical protein